MSLRILNLARDPVWGTMQQALANTFDAQTTMLGAVDISEDAKSFIFKADAPGLTKKDLKVQISDGNLLTISGERRKESEEHSEDNTYHRVERSFGKFSRAFRLPDNCDPSKLNATCVDGVLCVSVPKCDNPPARAFEVEIK